ncbi:hypothetical protein HYX14_00430 [Candidatus Woesearchaeota archaeon]|nr:hypothetical protein [Candidatus Woesearchaeota archaeon]
MSFLFRKYQIIRNFPPHYPWYKKIFANLLYWITGMIIHSRKNLLTQRDIIRARVRLRRGDILLLGNLRESSSLFITGPLTHSAIYVGRRRVIEAVGRGVQYNGLQHLFSNYDTLAILRLPKGTRRRHWIIHKAIRFAKEQLGKPYDFDFDAKSGKYFCTELVNKAFRQAGHNTGLRDIKPFRTFFEKMEKLLFTVRKILQPEEFVRGNFRVVFMSHNLRMKRRRMVLT